MEGTPFNLVERVASVLSAIGETKFSKRYGKKNRFAFV